MASFQEMGGGKPPYTTSGSVGTGMGSIRSKTVDASAHSSGEYMGAKDNDRSVLVLNNYFVIVYSITHDSKREHV